MKKNFLLAAILTLQFFSPDSVWSQSTVTVTRTSGAVYTYTVQTDGNITFNGDYVIIKESATSDETSIQMSGIRSMKFSDGLSGINDISATSAPILYPNPAKEYCIVRTNESGPHRVSVYTMTGALLIDTTVEEGGRLDISGLPSAIYMVKINNTTTKLCKW